MIATRRGLELLVAIAVLLGVLLSLDLRRTSPTTDRSLARGLDVDAVSALGWQRQGQPELHLAREGERWVWIKPIEAAADRSAVANLLATLRAARWHRREPASAAGPTHAVLTISTASPTTGGKPPEYADLPRRTLAIGAPLPGTEQAWIVDGEDALLVDAWVARALDPDPVTLMVRLPLDAIAQAPWIKIGDMRRGLQIEGAPRRLVSPYVAVVRSELIENLQQAVGALEIVSLRPSPWIPGPTPSSPPTLAPEPPSDPITIEVPSGSFVIGQSCGDPGHVRLSSRTVTGCVTREAYVAALTAIEALHATARDVMEPRPAPVDAATITLRDGAILDVTKLRIGEHAADPVRVTELLSLLAAPAELTDAPRTAKVIAKLEITDRHAATISLELLPGGVVRRPGEDLGMKVTPASASVLERTAAAYRDLTPWSEDPLAVLAIRIDDNRSSVRGAVIGEWSHPNKSSQMPWAEAAQSTALELLASQLAAPRPISPGPPAFATAHRVVIVIKPPAGPVLEHALEVGRKTAAGCPVRASGMALLLPAPVCEAIATIAR